ncbi:hypothetical protein DM01DRAFT_1386495 [Hesseltinella vesiculosa]|uniref:BHLH domain-containing protein n=1 Tax=Hesseltinella vesiculosa TaxID=101127 RepID=A0A1X2G5N4_9FUNG|nr:hypothetical protein DM01DRAFT_1386495 [Hesseltinella vesiculosa]
MPSDKFKISKASRSIRHVAQNFFGTFSISPNGSTQSTSYPIIGGNIPSGIHEDPETHLDRRSAHNALERQRRETLNTKFQELAHALPALQTVRRPSKTLIVSKSLEYVTKTMHRENTYVSQIKELRKQNERLRKQAKAAKLMMLKQQQQMVKNHRTPLSPPSSSNNTTSTVTSASSMQRSISTAQTSVTSSLDNVDCPHMSPPLTPETPNKPHHLIKEEPLPSKVAGMPATSPAIHDKLSPSSQPWMPYQPSNLYDNVPANMMMPQWSTSTITSPTDMVMVPNNGYYLYSPPQTAMYPQPSAQTPNVISHPDTINPMLFSPYQWQDGRSTYAKDTNDVFLL